MPANANTSTKSSPNGSASRSHARFQTGSRRDIFFGSPRFRLPWIFIVISLVASLPWVVMRWSFENSFNQAQITVDYNDTRSLADAYGVTQESLLRDLKSRGVTSVAIYQQTLLSLRDLGRLSLTPRETAERIYPDIPWSTVPSGYRYLITFMSDASLLQSQVFAHLKAQSSTMPPRSVVLGIPAVRAGGPASLAPRGILVSASAQLLSDATMGFDPSHVGLLKRVGLVPTARLSNALNLTLPLAEEALDEAKKTGAKVVLFSEDEVLGYETLMPLVAKATRERGLIFGTIEFSKQRGNEEFSKLTDGLIARVHSVNGDEAAKLTYEAILDRYVRAVKERDIHIAYIRLPRQFKGEYHMPAGGILSRLRGTAPTEEKPKLAKTARQENLDLVEEIATELRTPAIPGLTFLRPPFETGQVQGFGSEVDGKFLPFPLNSLQPALGERGAKIALILFRFLGALGVVGSVLLMLHLFFDLSPRAARNWLWTGLGLAFLCSLSGGMGAKLLGLGAGVPFSFVGVMWGGFPELWDRGLRRSERLSVGHALVLGFKVLIRTTLITSIGGFLIILFLGSWQYMSKADEFLGEKATLTVPILLVALAFAGEVFPHRVVQEGAGASQNRLRVRYLAMTSRPFSIGVALGLGALVMAAYIYIARTGNESGMEVSPLELALRSTLERFFITRPRTKEIFVAHPAMIFAVYFALRRWRLLALAAITAVAMGQSDVINTLCHIHTPLFYSIWRVIIGVILGAIIGGVALWVWVKIENRVLPPQLRNLMSSSEDDAERDEEDSGLEGAFNGTSVPAAGRVY